MSFDPAVTSLFFALVALGLLAVTSIRYGVDSREDFTGDTRVVVRRGIL